MFETLDDKDTKEAKCLHFGIAVLAHCALSVFPLALPIGCIADGIAHSAFPIAAPFWPGTCAIALLCGFFMGYRAHARAASWTWVPATIGLTLYLLCAIISWTPDELRWTGFSRLSFAWYGAFGSEQHCADSECLGHLFIGATFLSAVLYSIGAKIGLLMRKREEGALAN